MTDSELDMERLPRHVAVIMDGNGRWAQARGWKRLEGHKAGVESVREVIRTCREIGIPFLTLYTFSEENWNRPEAEVKGLMSLLNHYLKREIKELHQNGVQIRVIGDTSRLPKVTQKLLANAIEETAGNKELVLVLALSYGGRQEIIMACRKAAEECLKGSLKPEEIDETYLGSRLFTADLPDPDLLIRTGGEHRVSNFLLWQIAYSELLITETHWPDFRREELVRALMDFQGRQRRFGRTGDQVLEGTTGPVQGD